MIFEEKCLKSSSNITLDCKTFFDFEIDNINGIEFYNKKWRDEYDCLIKDINDEEYIKLLLKCEEEQAEKVSNLYKIPLLKYNMQFNNNDAKNVIELLKHIGG